MKAWQVDSKPCFPEENLKKAKNSRQHCTLSNIVLVRIAWDLAGIVKIHQFCEVC